MGKKLKKRRNNNAPHVNLKKRRTAANSGAQPKPAAASVSRKRPASRRTEADADESGIEEGVDVVSAVKTNKARVRPASGPPKKNLEPKPAVKRPLPGKRDSDVDDGNEADAESDSDTGHLAKRQRRGSAKKDTAFKDGLRTTTTALASKQDDPVLMVQYGGGQGSNAGDAAIFSLRKSRRLFSLDFGGTKGQIKAADAGREKERKAAPDDSDESDFESEEEYSGLGKDIAFFSHSHKDHTGGKTTVSLKKHDAIRTGPSKPANVSGDTVEGVGKNGEVLFSWVNKEKAQKRDKVKIAVRGTAIMPKTKKNVEDENERSMGALLSVDTTPVKGKQKRAFTMLSLGDMTPEEASANVKKVWQDDGKKTVDLIKMAHHGSENNIDVIPRETVAAKTTDIVVSGYTMTDASALTTFVTDTKPKRVIILFSDKDRAAYFDSLQTIKNLIKKAREVGTEVIVAKDLVISVDKTGKPSHEPTRWQ